MRICATVFACAFAVPDGNASVQQALSGGWAVDVVALIIVAIAAVNVLPVFIAAAYAERAHGTVACLAVTWLLVVGVSVPLTMQRVGAQIDADRSKIERADYPRVVLARALDELKATRSALDAEHDATASARDQAVRGMRYQEFEAENPGQGVAWRAERDKRDDATAKLARIEGRIAELDAKIASAGEELKAMGPPPADRFAWIESATAYTLAFAPTLGAIGLLLYAAGGTRKPDPADTAQRQTTARDCACRERHGAALRHATADDCTRTARELHEGEKPQQIQSPASVPPELVVQLRADARRPLTETRAPTKHDIRMAGAVADILRESKRRGRLLTWTEIASRYGTASNTTTNYRRAAIAQWNAMQSGATT